MPSKILYPEGFHPEYMQDVAHDYVAFQAKWMSFGHLGGQQRGYLCQN